MWWIIPLILAGLGLWHTEVTAAQLSATWTAPTTNTDGSPLTDLAGYRVYLGLRPATYTTVTDVGLTTQAILGDLQGATTYYLAATAYDTSGNESRFSPEAVATTKPAAPSVVMTHPADGELVRRKSHITITASATGDPPIERIEFLVNGQPQCIDRAPPYRCAWKVPAPKGQTYDLLAMAYEAAGPVVAQAQVTVTAR